MSDYVVHFTRDYGGNTAFENIMTILGSRRLAARNPFGIGRKSSPDVDCQMAVCFSEIPLHRLTRISRRRGEYGIVFSKKFISGRGGLPVWYVESSSTAATVLRSLMAHAKNEHAGSELQGIWNLAPFIDFPGTYGDVEYRFEWEREWRHVGDLDFHENDPSFLIIPEGLHRQAIGFFEEAKAANTGPSYECPFIDASWSQARVELALASARNGHPYEDA
jgi:hypothetical protein